MANARLSLTTSDNPFTVIRNLKFRNRSPVVNSVAAKVGTRTLNARLNSRIRQPANVVRSRNHYLAKKGVDPIADRTDEINRPITALQVVATDDGTSLTYAADGLPTGIGISSSGRITGTPTEARSFSASVTVTDEWNAATTEAFTWTIGNAPPPARRMWSNKVQLDHEGVNTNTSTQEFFSDNCGTACHSTAIVGRPNFDNCSDAVTNLAAAIDSVENGRMPDPNGFLDLSERKHYVKLLKDWQATPSSERCL